MQAAAGLPSILIVLLRLSDFSAQALLSKWDVELNLRHVQRPSDSLLLKRASFPGSRFYLRIHYQLSRQNTN